MHHDLQLHPHGLDDADLPLVRGLARACLEHDGGLPLLLEDDVLRARFHGGTALTAWDTGGQLVALGRCDGHDPAETTGMVHPGSRSQGLGRRLMEWAREQGGGRVTVLTETDSQEATRLYARFGLSRNFAETVMRHDLGRSVDRVMPAGMVFTSSATASRRDLYETYVRAFADRPGFPHPAESEWIADLEDEPSWDRDLSGVVVGPDAGPVAFITVVGAWIDQVGVVPDHRGRGIGGHLVARAISGLARAGRDEAWLTVGVTNPAQHLYRELGFTAFGTRARYA